ncbi:4687_t:CDS:2 [Acaulospora morrowiae]|uniref:4687_t:CDS:1 n=1 Tax=Acaulospora morrowiae TaxID=94023 RepID=A0A9N8V643_9GLOM|nr:4687_t:CDS:2 [Acaulospora morrowiae]
MNSEARKKSCSLLMFDVKKTYESKTTTPIRNDNNTSKLHNVLTGKTVRGDCHRANKSNAMISKILSRLWKNENEEVKLYWRKLADKKKVEHMEAYPEYVYRPKKTKINNIKKRRKSDSIESNLSARKTITPTPTATLISPQIPSPTPPQLTEIYHNTTTVEELPLHNDLLWNLHAPQYNGTIRISTQNIRELSEQLFHG